MGHYVVGNYQLELIINSMFMEVGRLSERANVHLLKWLNQGVVFE